MIDPNTLAPINTVESSWGKIKSLNKKQWGTGTSTDQCWTATWLSTCGLSVTGPENLFETMLQHIVHFMPPESKK